jgi:antitoxin (DNA-binding transcriptional repressor) of toxin-antitoxin stability system
MDVRGQNAQLEIRKLLKDSDRTLRVGNSELTQVVRCVALRSMKTVSISELHARTGKWVRAASRHGRILVTYKGETIATILPETEVSRRPYFSERNVSAAFSKLEGRSETGRGTDITKMISEDREERA